MNRLLVEKRQTNNFQVSISSFFVVPNPGSSPIAIKRKREGLGSVGLTEKSLKLMENF